jgi:hypothetical protein
MPRGEPWFLFHVIAGMPPDSARRLLTELTACVQLKQKQLNESRDQLDATNYKSHKRRWFAVQEFVANQTRIIETSLEGPESLRPSTCWTDIRGAGMSTPDQLSNDDLCMTCTRPGHWIAYSCSRTSGSLALGPNTSLDPSRWQAQIKHAMKSALLDQLQNQNIKPDRVLRGWISETKPSIFWVGADAESTMDGAARRVKAKSGHEIMVLGDEAGTWKHCIAWVAPTQRIKDSRRDDPAAVAELWCIGRLHVLEAAPRTMGGQWRITLGPPSDVFGGVTMLVTDYQGPTLSAFMALRCPTGELPMELDTPTPSQCTGPVNAALRWTTTAPPLCDVANVFAGLFDNDSTFEDLPTVLKERLDAEQRQVLSNISKSDKAFHVVDALAGTGKSHLARCMINRWASIGNSNDGFLVVALRTRTLRHEFMTSLDQVRRNICREQ